MATDLQTIVVGDTMTPIDMTITDANNAAVNLTSHECGSSSAAPGRATSRDERPAEHLGADPTTSAKTITRASGLRLGRRPGRHAGDRHRDPGGHGRQDGLGAHAL